MVPRGKVNISYQQKMKIWFLLWKVKEKFHSNSRKYPHFLLYFEEYGWANLLRKTNSYLLWCQKPNSYQLCPHPLNSVRRFLLREFLETPQKTIFGAFFPSNCNMYHNNIVAPKCTIAILFQKNGSVPKIPEWSRPRTQLMRIVTFSRWTW